MDTNDWCINGAEIIGSNPTITNIFLLNATNNSNTSSVGEMLNELQWPTLEARGDQSSLLFCHKIHFGNMSIDKDK